MREEARERNEAAKKEANIIQKETNQNNANVAKIMSLLQMSTANSQQETKGKEEQDKQKKAEKEERDKQEKALNENMPSFRAIVNTVPPCHRILQQMIKSKAISNDGDTGINHMILHDYCCFDFPFMSQNDPTL